MLIFYRSQCSFVMYPVALHGIIGVTVVWIFLFILPLMRVEFCIDGVHHGINNVSLTFF